jgi:hypothetical protein
MALFIFPAVSVDTSGLATEAKQDTIITELQDLDTNTADNATETTLSALNAKVTAVNTGAVTVSSSVLPTGAATEASLSAQATDVSLLEDRLAGSLVPETHDYIATTYVAAGNGAGEIETVTYRTGGAAGSIVATLTLTYDGSDRLSSVTRS